MSYETSLTQPIELPDQVLNEVVSGSKPLVTGAGLLTPVLAQEEPRTEGPGFGKLTAPGQEHRS
jgi:hypothetical protein